MAKTRRRTVRKSKTGRKAAISPIMIVVVVVGALLIVGGLIMLSNQARSADGTAEVSRFPALGAADAPVTIVEYSDYG